jgi:hypothetical protein
MLWQVELNEKRPRSRKCLIKNESYYFEIAVVEFYYEINIFYNNILVYFVAKKIFIGSLVRVEI